MRGDHVRPAVKLICNEPTRTKQSMSEQCDINNILNKFQKTGLLSHVNRFKGEYADYSENFDFKQSLEKLKNAQDMFLTIPAKVRKLFDNDPAKFLEFVNDPKNLDEMVSLGLAVKKDPERATAVTPSTGSGSEVSSTK